MATALLAGVLVFVAPSATAFVFLYNEDWTPGPAGYTIVPVCVVSGSTTEQSHPVFQTNAPGIGAVLSHIREALAESWEASSSLRFTGFHPCSELSGAQQSGTAGLCIIPNANSGGEYHGQGDTDPSRCNNASSISTADVNLHPWGFGGGPDACIKLSSAYVVRYAYQCVERYAIHEFGHLVGLAHEWYNPATSGSCRSDNPDHVSPYLTAQVTTEYNLANAAKPELVAFVPNATRFDNRSAMTYDLGWTSQSGTCAYHQESGGRGSPAGPANAFQIPFGSVGLDEIGNGGRGGRAGLSATDRSGIAQVYPPPRPGPDDVGVLRVAGDEDCNGGQAEPLTVGLDTEDDDSPGDTIKGWSGASLLRQFAGTGLTLEFCRVDGNLFHRWSHKYAVLKLGTRCPPDSTGFSRYFDTEDDDDTSFHSGDIGPYNTAHPGTDTNFGGVNGGVKGSVDLTFCVFEPAATDRDARQLPALPFGYGVLGRATGFEEGAHEPVHGVIHIYDEQTSNKDRLSNTDIARQIVEAGDSGDTYLFLLRVQSGATSTTTVTSSANGGAIVGEPVSFRAIVANAGGLPPPYLRPTGFVTFKQDGRPIRGCIGLRLDDYKHPPLHPPPPGHPGRGPLLVHCTLTYTDIGKHLIWAQYSGDAHHTPGASVPFYQFVQPPSPK